MGTHCTHPSGLKNPPQTSFTQSLTPSIKIKNITKKAEAKWTLASKCQDNQGHVGRQIPHILETPLLGSPARAWTRGLSLRPPPSFHYQTPRIPRGHSPSGACLFYPFIPCHQHPPALPLLLRLLGHCLGHRAHPSQSESSP